MQSRAVRHAGTCVLATAIAGGTLLGIGGEAGAQPVASTRTSSDTSPSSSRRAAAVNRYDSQKLSWRACLSRDELPGLPADYYRLECATMLAPRDWNTPQEGTDLRIRVSRLKSVKAKDPGMLFTNPGGPGAEGADLPLLLVSAQRKKLMASQDVYGMDVRGTGGSSNLTCGGVQNLTVDPRVRTASNVGLLLDAAELTAQACGVAGRDLRPFVTTGQTVHDVDLLRRIVGQDTVNWLGFSAGTWMGAHYATMFPERAGRMVFDSNVEFTGTWETAFGRQPLGFQRRFESDFAPWVAKYDSVYGLGSTPETVLASYERLRSRMTPDTPVADAVTLDDLMAGSMYAKYLFPDAASALSQLNGFVRAQSSGKFRSADKLADRVRTTVAALDRTGLHNSFSGDADPSVFLAVTCQDTPWTTDRTALAAASERAGKQYPLIGWSTIDQPCAFWDSAAAKSYAKSSDQSGTRLTTPTGKGLPPVLMVQSEHDPATPIEGAKAAAAGFAGARLLTVTGEGDHGLYAGGNLCVDQAVDSFLIKGKLPAEGATCKGTAMPKPGFGTMRSSRVPARNTNPLLAVRQISELVQTAP